MIGRCLLGAVIGVGACGPAFRSLPALALRADSSSREIIAPGLTHYSYTLRSGPWAIHVLDVDRAACWRLEGLKAGNARVGRATVTALIDSSGAIAGVNADFFLFDPPGVPRGAMIHQGGVIADAVDRPVFAVDSAGRPWIGFLRQNAGTLQPFHPMEAVGGFPILVRDSVEADTLDKAGSATFAPVRHPRTFVGFGAGGRRVLLVTVDGRQEGYSAGMTLRESAQLMRDLGAVEALNLDGGGSTTMVVRQASGPSRIVNRPSDAAGPRPVANALAVAKDPACQVR